MNTYRNKIDIIKKGYLIHKRHTKIFVILCSPLSISDVSTVYYSIFGGNGGLENKAAILGNIAFAAMEETPLLILLASEKETNRPIFIHFMNVNGIDDEVKLGQACCMRLHTNKADFTFSASTSTEYQDWISSFKDAYKKSHPVSKRKTVNTDVDDIDDLEENYTVDNIDPNMFIPYNPTATLSRTRSSPKPEKPLLGRLFSQCIPETSSNNSNNATVKQINSNKVHHHYSAAISRNVPSTTATVSPRHRANSIHRASTLSNHTPTVAAAAAATTTSTIKKPTEITKITHASLPPTVPTPINTTTTTATANSPSPSQPTNIAMTQSNYSDMPPLGPHTTVSLNGVNGSGLPIPKLVSPSSPIEPDISKTEQAISVKTS